MHRQQEHQALTLCVGAHLTRCAPAHLIYDAWGQVNAGDVAKPVPAQVKRQRGVAAAQHQDAAARVK